eukprot:TRINITY_DN1410_c1_g1_i13.p1 TRINITY_DN1410_c1_g1~~TRINITY_DN1410_c1_g1_i13.p1  ORF type:complete len:345 (-),score=65.53 TRINITY_DN1410_c1_g1_i13:826-1860(-)
MVSFGMDCHWMRSKKAPRLATDHALHCSPCRAGRAPCYVKRQESAGEEACYSLRFYLAYLLYAPLYIAGPIISFNAFVSQLEVPQRAYSWRQLSFYTGRWLACLLCMELLTHFCFFPALANSGLWTQLPALDVCILGYGVLNVMWLKFLLIWRFFRLVSLAAGVEAPENMLRCLNNSYTIEGFWKGWHASYNRWLVRYLYIPLGGAKWRLLNTWAVFTFVALWHDIDWRLLGWAWITCLLTVPEQAGGALMASKQMRAVRGTFAERELLAAGGALNIVGLMGANLVGFVIGLDGIRVFAAKLMTWENTWLPLAIFFSFYVGTKLMLEIRAAKGAQRQPPHLAQH